MNKRYSEQDVIDALQAYERKTGRPPTFNDWRAAKRSPGRQAIISRFGTWSNALVAAGIQESPPGGQRKYDENEELIKRNQAGESLGQIGRSIGITGQALGRRLARHQRAIEELEALR
jgi:hypothetical protein